MKLVSSNSWLVKSSKKCAVFLRRDSTRGVRDPLAGTPPIRGCLSRMVQHELTDHQRALVIAGLSGSDVRTAAKFIKGQPVKGHAIRARLAQAQAILASLASSVLANG